MKISEFNVSRWIHIALINFSIVALAGIILRYKINFSLPMINQKNLLHGHSHFAFTGWVTLALMALLVNYLQKHHINNNNKKYHWILLANCLVSYGMLFSFIAEGYAFYSIAFSTLSIFVSYFFIFHFWRDLGKIKDKCYAPTWFKAALILWAISSLGAFTLAFLMAIHNKIQDLYFGAIYFFLHFQYNGWFLFVCFGLLFSYLSDKLTPTIRTLHKKIFMVMAITVAPTYFLSVLWLKLPAVLHIVADIAAVLQLIVLFYFLKLILLLKKVGPTNFVTKYLWMMASVAFILKIILQLLSTVPFLSNYAFAFRPIVIGYLHLSFLGIISFFILGYINQILLENGKQVSKTGTLIFSFGVVLQEVILMAQGLEVMAFKPIPFANIILFFTAIIIGTGLICISLKLKTVSKASVIN